MTKRNFEYILFDWDGCLANTLPIWMQVYKKVFASYGFYPTEKDIAEKVFGKLDGNRIIGVTDDEGFREKLSLETREHLSEAKLFEHVYDTLIGLKKTKRLALLSSSPKFVVEKATMFNKVYELFEIILAAEDQKYHKPDPWGINTIMNFFSAKKEEVIMVGDADKDVLACHNAGIASCVFYPETNKSIYDRDFLLSLKADYFIEDFGELLKIV